MFQAVKNLLGSPEELTYGLNLLIDDVLMSVDKDAWGFPKFAQSFQVDILRPNVPSWRYGLIGFFFTDSQGGHSKIPHSPLFEHLYYPRLLLLNCMKE